MNDSVNDIKRRIRFIINVAVSANKITPEEALAILMTIIAAYVAQIDDDADRLAHVKMIEEHFGQFVEHWRIGDDSLLAMAEATAETRQ
jgi:hypothetical protein